MLPAPFVLILLLVFIPISPLYAASTCAGFIPASITTPANLIAAVNAAQSASCPGADTIDLAGNTITFTTAGFTDGGEDLALPAITTPITIMNGTITRSSAAGIKFLVVAGSNLTLDNLTVSNGGGPGIGGGGAIRVGDGNLIVTNTSFLSNSAPTYGGGAILANGTGSLTIRDSLFRWNEGGLSGGAINMQSESPLTVDRTRFERHNAPAGASIMVSATDNAMNTVRDSLFVGNSGALGNSIYTVGLN